MSIVVTAASSRLGRHVVEALLARGVPASGIIATGRDVARIKDLADRGIVVRRADFADPASLSEAFEGAGKLLLISTTDVGQRVANHRRAMDAAMAAGASLIAYTSMLHADTATSILGATHYATEQDLRHRSVPSVMLRNSWYLENYIDQLPQVSLGGILAGATGSGRISAATRADYADAAAVVLTSEGHAGQVYELGGDEAFTLGELAATISAVTGEQITHADLSVSDFTQALVDAGLPAELAHILADADLAMSRGELFTDSGDLSRLIGRPTVRPAQAIAAAIS